MKLPLLVSKDFQIPVSDSWHFHENYESQRLLLIVDPSTALKSLVCRVLEKRTCDAKQKGVGNCICEYLGKYRYKSCIESEMHKS